MRSDISRRAAITGTAAAVAVVAGAPALAATDHPDAHLFALWREYQEAEAVRKPLCELYVVTHYDHPDHDARDKAAGDAAWRSYDIAAEIGKTDATTPDGLALKLHVLQDNAGPRHRDEEWTVKQGAMASLVRSVEAMGGRFNG